MTFASATALGDFAFHQETRKRDNLADWRIDRPKGLGTRRAVEPLRIQCQEAVKLGYAERSSMADAGSE
jgi:hypothetical protein